MPEFPQGAVKSKEELLAYCKKQNGKPFFFYLVENTGVLEKRVLYKPWLRESEDDHGILCLCDKFKGGDCGRFLPSLGLQPPTKKGHPNAAMFLNYWDAWAFSQRQKQRLASEAKQAV